MVVFLQAVQAFEAPLTAERSQLLGSTYRIGASIPVGVKTERVEEKIPAAAWQHDGKVEVVVQPASPITSSPARAQSGRKWARKVD